MNFKNVKNEIFFGPIQWVDDNISYPCLLDEHTNM